MGADSSGRAPGETLIYRSRITGAAVATLAGALLLTGCWHRHQAPVVPATEVHEIIPATSGAPTRAVPTVPLSALPEAPEPFVDLEMADAPVKLILQRLADIGGLQLIIPANLNKTLSVQYIHVPVSVALNDVLRRASLRLGAGPTANLPFDTVTVFYQLPANVDSLSIDAIIRRFGVSRAMAELLVKSRRP
jgi:hypothetical protein